MGECGDALVRPVILLVVHVRLTYGGEQAVLCGASSRRCKEASFWLCSPGCGETMARRQALLKGHFARWRLQLPGCHVSAHQIQGRSRSHGQKERNWVRPLKFVCRGREACSACVHVPHPSLCPNNGKVPKVAETTPDVVCFSQPSFPLQQHWCSVLPHPREDGPPPPPGARLPSDGPPSPAKEPHYHYTRTFSGTEIALQNERMQWQLAHTTCGDMHHRALNHQRSAPKQFPLWSG